MKIPYVCALTLAVLLTVAPTAASAALLTKFTDRAAFNAVSGPTAVETFNSITSDIELDTAYSFGAFSMKNERVGVYGRSYVDAAPFNVAASLNGTTFVQSTVYNVADTFRSSLVFSFSEGITAFGANFTSGAAGNIQLLVDGQPFDGYLAEQGGFFGFTSDTPVSTIELRARAGSGYPYTFDDVTFSTAAVPEPASWAMMIAGFAAVGQAMRRRRTSQLQFA